MSSRSAIANLGRLKPFSAFPHWGKQAFARPDKRPQIDMMFQGLTRDEALAAWKPLIDFANASADYLGKDALSVHAFPARCYWDAASYHRYAPSAVVFDTEVGNR
jgi:hypothetical protein